MQQRCLHYVILPCAGNAQLGTRHQGPGTPTQRLELVMMAYISSKINYNCAINGCFSLAGCWRRASWRGKLPKGHLMLRAMAQDQRQELLKQVNGVLWRLDLKPAHRSMCLSVPFSQIEERKRLHAKLMEKVRERSATRTTTAEVGSHFSTACVAKTCAKQSNLMAYHCMR